MTLILWDIDGTLVRGKGGRVSVNAFTRALQHAGHFADAFVYPKDVAGKTDAQIALEVLQAAAVAETDARALLPAFGEAYLQELEQLREELRSDLLVLAGVPQVLQRLRQLGVPQSLLTGNLKPVAQLKLSLAGLEDYVNFEVGAYGSDHHDRTCLVPIVRQRMQTHEDDIVVVGDTPRDIACARAGDARVVAVATGNFSREQLEAHAPDALLEDLSDTEAVVRTLLRYSTNSEQERALIV